MKRIIYITLILLSVLSCKKPDSKIEKLIVGTWKVEPKHDIGLTGGVTKFPHCLPISISFFTNGTYLINDVGGNNTMLTPRSYSIKNGILYFDSLVCSFSSSDFLNEVEIRKISKNKMKLMEYNDYWMYVKN